MAGERRHEHQVDRPVADRLIGDVDVDALGVVGFRNHGDDTIPHGVTPAAAFAAELPPQAPRGSLSHCPVLRAGARQASTAYSRRSPGTPLSTCTPRSAK